MMHIFLTCSLLALSRATDESSYNADAENQFRSLTGGAELPQHVVVTTPQQPTPGTPFQGFARETMLAVGQAMMTDQSGERSTKKLKRSQKKAKKLQRPILYDIVLDNTGSVSFGQTLEGMVTGYNDLVEREQKKIADSGLNALWNVNFFGKGLYEVPCQTMVPIAEARKLFSLSLVERGISPDVPPGFMLYTPNEPQTRLYASTYERIVQLETMLATMEPDDPTRPKKIFMYIPTDGEDNGSASVPLPTPADFSNVDRFSNASGFVVDALLTQWRKLVQDKMDVLENPQVTKNPTWKFTPLLVTSEASREKVHFGTTSQAYLEKHDIEYDPEKPVFRSLCVAASAPQTHSTMAFGAASFSQAFDDDDQYRSLSGAGNFRSLSSAGAGSFDDDAGGGTSFRSLSSAAAAPQFLSAPSTSQFAMPPNSPTPVTSQATAIKDVFAQAGATASELQDSDSDDQDSDSDEQPDQADVAARAKTLEDLEREIERFEAAELHADAGCGAGKSE